MAYHVEKSNGDLVIDGFDQGIGRSPHKGVANMQAVNISTESGEVMCSYARVQQSQPGDTGTSHTINALDASHLSTSFSLVNGAWINVSSSTISGLSTGNYYIQNSNGTGSGVAATSFQISSFYNSAILSGFGLTGTATFNLIRAMGQPVASATEPYSNGTSQYRYYILDNQGLVWVQDTAVGSYWFLPDFSITYYSGTPSGLAVINGWLHVFAGTDIWCKPTVSLANSTATTTNYASFASGTTLTTNTHYAFAGHQGKLYYTDQNSIGSIFPNTSLLSGTANIQSYASYTAATTTGTISQLISGSIPYNGVSNATRIPAVFFHALTASGANPGAVAIGTIFYIKYNAPTAGHFEVYAAASGGSALDLATGAVGTQYFATYYPTSTGGEAIITFTQQRLNLPFFEVAQAITEIGNIVLIGTQGNVIYPWNQVDPLPNDLIPLPESNVASFLTVNNMAYIFAGFKGNIYVTNGSTASLVLSVPDYCAGIAGTPSSYVEPYFIWGGTMFLRGRVYFSLQDQTAAKTGNCGGVWSFVPTQSFFIGQDTGLSLRMDNQNSYGTYNGYATVLLASQNQSAKGAQYWAGWASAISAASYGIDFSGTTPSTPAVIETDLIPTGTLLGKATFEQIEYKLAAPLQEGESVAISYRQDGTSVYQSFGSPQTETTTGLSGYFTPVTDFEAGQWLQLKITLTPITTTTSSFVRLFEIRVR